MAAGVVLDTSYLITLADPARPYHPSARQYWRHFTEQSIPIFLPTIVASEFYVRQEIPPDILRACVVLPFNWDDALKDDVKIIAQAMVKDAAWIITDDTKSFYKFAYGLQAAGKARFRPIKLEDGFDTSLFDPSGQHQFGFNPQGDESATGE